MRYHRSDRHRINSFHARKAFTLIEALVLMVVLSIVGMGVGIGLQSVSRVSGQTDLLLAVSTELNSEADNWRAVAFTGATWPSSIPYSKNDTVTLSVEGRSITYTRAVTIKNWDPNNMTTNASPVADFVQVKITINGQSLTIYVTKPI